MTPHAARVRWIADVGQDVRYLSRALRANPGFGTAVILTLALGIGANTAVFSVVNAVLLTPPPYPDPDRIVMLVNTFRGRVSAPGTSAPKFTVWRQSTTAFAEVAVYALGRRSLDVTNGDDPRAVPVGRASVEFFHLFGVRVARGRTFTAAEDRPGGPHVAVVSDRFSRKEFGESADAVGHAISIDGDRFVVVGVIDGGFDTDALSVYPSARPEIWLPLQLDPNSSSDLNYLLAAGRLRPDVSLQAAQAQTAVAAAAVRQAFPAVMPVDFGLSVERLQGVLARDVRPALLLLWWVVAFVLLIACANAVNLLLARASIREREIAIRVATGASRGRIVRQLLTESVVLAVSGGVVGFLIGTIGVRALLSIQGWSPPGIVFSGSGVTLDPRVFVFTLIISVVTGVAFGLVPAWRASRVDPDVALKTGGRADSGGSSRIRASLVVTEVALALMLLIGSALLIRSFVALREVNPGFDAHNVLTMETATVGRRFATTAPLADMVNNGLQRVSAVAGVDVAAATFGGLPFESNGYLNVGIVGRPRDDQYYAVGWFLISPRYFETLRIPLLRGRGFNDRDTHTSTPVVLINEAMAKRWWAGADPMRDRLLIAPTIGGELEESVPRQIIGVVADVHYQALSWDPRASVFVPLAQSTDGQTAFRNRLGARMTWIVRTKAEPHRLADAIQREIRTAGGGLPAERIRTMDDVSATSTAQNAFEAWLMTIFGAVAMLLAAVGLYGVMSYSVEQRRREIGIRMALGADVAQVRRMVLGQGMTLTAAGIVVGIASAMGSTRMLSGFLFGVGPHDRIAFVSVPLVLSVIALAAVWIPARSATSVDPMIALRAE